MMLAEIPHDMPDEQSPARRTKPSILLIDDNADARESLGMILELMGYHTFAAGDGQEGLELLTHLHPDLAIVDIGLPTLCGYEVASKARRAGVDAPLIALSGYSEKSDVDQAERSGFNAHLAKPASPEVLLELIVTLLGAKAVIPAPVSW